MAGLNFHHNYSSLQCNVNFQKSFYNMLICCSRNILIIDVEKVVHSLHNILIEAVTRFVKDFLMNKSSENSIYLKQTFSNNMKVFTVTFDRFNASLLNKSVNLF